MKNSDLPRFASWAVYSERVQQGKIFAPHRSAGILTHQLKRLYGTVPYNLFDETHNLRVPPSVSHPRVRSFFFHFDDFLVHHRQSANGLQKHAALDEKRASARCPPPLFHLSVRPLSCRSGGHPSSIAALAVGYAPGASSGAQHARQKSERYLGGGFCCRSRSELQSGG